MRSQEEDSILITGQGTDGNPLVGSQVIQQICNRDQRNVRYRRNGALCISGVIVSRTRDAIARFDQVYLAMNMLEAEESAWNDRNNVLLVVDPREVGNLFVVSITCCTELKLD